MTPGDPVEPDLAPVPRPGDAALRAAAVMVIVALSIVFLALGAGIVLPLVEAVILWFVINRFATTLRRLPGIGARLGQGASCILAAALVSVIAVAAIYSGVRGVLSAGTNPVSLQSSLDPLVSRIAGILGTNEVAVLERVVDSIGLETLMQQFVLGLMGLINQFGVIAIYVAFLFADQAMFGAKMRALMPDPAKRKRFLALLVRIEQQIGSYLWIMTRISALTALLSFLVMVLLGLDYPVFWALLVFFLNFIPTIGSVLGALLPAAFALVQFGELLTPTILGLLLGAVQMTMGNVIFPRMAGNALNLSFLVTILCLFIWGAIWGVTGMFLAVPLTAALVIVMAQFDATRAVAILLSKTGQFDPVEDPSETTASADP